jgi:serine/threonine protein kinase
VARETEVHPGPSSLAGKLVATVPIICSDHVRHRDSAGTARATRPSPKKTRAELTRAGDAKVMNIDVGADEECIGSAYILGAPISCGAMGRVFHGTRRASGESVAIKILRDELSRDQELVRRFVQERQVLTSLSHPHLLRVRDMVVEGDRLAIIMDYVSGGTLRDRLTRTHTLAPGEAASLAAQVLEAVAAAHAAGVVHRDLKPENILLADDGGVKVADFGIARLIDGTALTSASGYIGSAEYMAPECANGGRAGPLADVYAVGCLLYELLVGVTPFVGGASPVVLLRHLRNAPTRPVGVPGALWNLLRRLLAKQPDSRPGAMDAAAELQSMTATLDGLRALPSLGDPNFGSVETTLPRQRALLNGGTPVPPSGGRRDSGSSLTTLPARSRPQLPPPLESPLAVTRPWWRRPIAAAAAVVLLVVTTIAVVAWSSPGQAANPPVVTFTPQTFPSGLTVNRSWRVRDGKQRELNGVLRLVNSSNTALAVAFDEVLPRSVATSPNQVDWQPAPAEIVKPDLVVRFWAAALSPGKSIDVNYHAVLPKKADAESQLHRLADDQRAAESAYQAGAAPADRPARLRQLTVEPASLQLAAGASVHVSLSGELDNGQPAPDAALANTSWTSSATDVAAVSAEPGGGTVHAIRPGESTLTASIGSVHGAGLLQVTTAASAELGQGVAAGVQPKDPGRPVADAGSTGTGGAGTSGSTGAAPGGNGPTGTGSDGAVSGTGGTTSGGASPGGATGSNGTGGGPDAGAGSNNTGSSGGGSSQGSSGSTGTTSPVPPLAMAPISLPDAVDGKSYQQKLTVSGGQPPYQWSAVDLPGGLSVSGGVVAGRPLVDVIGTIGVGGTIKVTDASGQTASQHFTLNITRITDDLNRDGAADCTDLNILKSNMFAQGVGYNRGDMNSDGTVNVLDLSYFLSHWPAGGPTCS